MFITVSEIVLVPTSGFGSLIVWEVFDIEPLHICKDMVIDISWIF